MTVIRMPSRRMASQVNRNRDWPVGYVSPQDGTPARLDIEKREIRDDHGNVIPADTMAGNRPWQIFRRFLRQQFGW